MTDRPQWELQVITLPIKAGPGEDLLNGVIHEGLLNKQRLPVTNGSAVSNTLDLTQIKREKISRNINDACHGKFFSRRMT